MLWNSHSRPSLHNRLRFKLTNDETPTTKLYTPGVYCLTIFSQDAAVLLTAFSKCCTAALAATLEDDDVPVEK